MRERRLTELKVACPDVGRLAELPCGLASFWPKLSWPRPGG
jgi:hypothetical protein